MFRTYFISVYEYHICDSISFIANNIYFVYDAFITSLRIVYTKLILKIREDSKRVIRQDEYIPRIRDFEPL